MDREGNSSKSKFGFSSRGLVRAGLAAGVIFAGSAMDACGSGDDSYDAKPTATATATATPDKVTTVVINTAPVAPTPIDRVVPLPFSCPIEHCYDPKSLDADGYLTLPDGRRLHPNAQGVLVPVPLPPSCNIECFTPLTPVTGEISVGITNGAEIVVATLSTPEAVAAPQAH